MGSPLPGLYGAAGAYQGLKDLLAQRMAEAQFQELQRRTRAEEALKARQLTEQGADRRLQQESLNTYRQSQLSLAKLGRALDADREERLSKQFSETSQRLGDQFWAGQAMRTNEMDLRDKIAGMQNAIGQGNLDVRQGALAIERLNNEIARLRLEREANPDFVRGRSAAAAQGTVEGKEAGRPPSLTERFLVGAFPKLFGPRATRTPPPQAPPPQAAQPPSHHRIGDTVQYRGRSVVITDIDANGNFYYANAKGTP